MGYKAHPGMRHTWTRYADSTDLRICVECGRIEDDDGNEVRKGEEEEG
jgi:hypothetical protein